MIARYLDNPAVLISAALATILIGLFFLAMERDNTVLTVEDQRACVATRFETTGSYIQAVTDCARNYGVSVAEIERNLP